MSGAEHEEREPVRLSSAGSGAAPALRAALEAGRAELPNDAQLGALASRIGAVTAPVAVGVTTGLWPIVATVVVLGGLGVAGVYVARTREPAPEPARAAPTQPGAGADAAIETDAGLASDAAAALESWTDAGARHAAVRVPREHQAVDAGVAPAPEIDVDAELALLRSAQDALRAEPARALAIAAEHARRFGDGTLAQEREVVAIEALVSLARLPEARERAERFRARWPRSAHVRRLAVILGEASP